MTRMISAGMLLIAGTGAFADVIPCEGQPRVLCARAVKLAHVVAKRNFLSFGTGERRVFRGSFHTRDKDGTERFGPAMGKNLSFSIHTTRFRGIKDAKQYVMVETNNTSNTVTFSMVVEKFYGYVHLSFDDPRMKVSLRPLGGAGWNRLTFDGLEARNVPISHIAGTGTGATGHLLNMFVVAVASPTLKDLIDASLVPSYASHKGSDVDLVAAQANGTLEVVPGATDAVYTTNDSFLIARVKKGEPFQVNGVVIPDAELPPECLDPKTKLGKVTYRAEIQIPVNQLGGTFVRKAKPFVEKCW